MLLLTLVALQATAPSSSPADPPPATRYTRCVLEKARGWAQSKEEAKVIVETALGACGDIREEVRRYASGLLMKNGMSSHDATHAGVDGVMDKVDAKVRNLAYQAVIQARMP